MGVTELCTELRLTKCELCSLPGFSNRSLHLNKHDIQPGTFPLLQRMMLAHNCLHGAQRNTT